MQPANPPLPPEPEAFELQGTYSEGDIKAFSAFLAGRVAGSKIWALGLFVLMPLVWSGDFRRTWPLLVPLGLVLVGFMLLLRFVILPNRLYRAAARVPGVFAPRRVCIDRAQVRNESEAGSHTFFLEEVKEVVPAPEHLFVMLAPKQGIPIPKAWIGAGLQERRLVDRLLSRRISG